MSGELSCALTIEQLPEAFPAAVGAKLTVNVKLLLGDKVNGRDAPPTAKPEPLTVAWEMVTATLPELVTLKLWLLVDPTATFPKVIAAGLTLSAPEAAVSEFVVVVELPLALVTPEHPAKINAPDMRVKTMKMEDKFCLLHLERAWQTHQPRFGARAIISHAVLHHLGSVRGSGAASRRGRPTRGRLEGR